MSVTPSQKIALERAAELIARPQGATANEMAAELTRSGPACRAMVHVLRKNGHRIETNRELERNGQAVYHYEGQTIYIAAPADQVKDNKGSGWAAVFLALEDLRLATERVKHEISLTAVAKHSLSGYKTADILEELRKRTV